MKRVLTIVAGMLMTGVAAGQIYECVDAQGRREFAQFCSPGTVRQTQVQQGGAASGEPGTTAADKSLFEQEAAFRKRMLERQEAEAKAEKERAETEDSRRNCEMARSQLKELQDGQRISRIDPATGERSFLDDKSRPAEIAAAEKDVAHWCKR